MTQRMMYLGGFLVCVGLIAAALYFQYVMHLEPCPLCILQRVCVIATGLVLLVGALHNPGVKGQRVYGGLTVLTAGLGAGVAGRHYWIQHLPFDQQPGCSYDLTYMLEKFAITKMLKLVLQGSGDCAQVTWTFLGLSMPGWTLVFFMGFVGLGLMMIISPVVKRQH